MIARRLLGDWQNDYEQNDCSGSAGKIRQNDYEQNDCSGSAGKIRQNDLRAK
jgi:hypothetical protein